MRTRTKVLLFPIVLLIAAILALYLMFRTSPADIINFKADEIAYIDYIDCSWNFYNNENPEDLFGKRVTEEKDFSLILNAISNIEIISKYDNKVLLGGTSRIMFFHLKDGRSYMVDFVFIAEGAQLPDGETLITSINSVDYVAKSKQFWGLWDSLDYEMFPALEAYPEGFNTPGWQN